MPRILGLGLVLLFAGSSWAAEVKWRTDYSAARKESTETGKPLFIDVGTEDCVYCRKLDATTFRIAAVASFLNEKFIPVKVDAGREERLARGLGVDSFPTLIVASPEGRVLDRIDGYAEGPRLLAVLSKTSTREPAARSSKSAEQFQVIRRDFEAGNYLQVIERSRKLSGEFPESPESKEARKLSAEIAADPAKWQRVTGQLDSEFAALHKDLDAALRR